VIVEEADPLIDSVVGNYRVTGLLGRGGMGTVYRAEHPDIGRHVAIKVVSAQFSIHPAVMARFKAEALSVNRIGHPNIIDISDFGSLADGRPYFVMELLEGEDLGHRLQRSGTLAPETAAPILRETLDALAAAHAENIIHRDLKPDNIFLARRRGSEIVKLLDFGIAKLRTEGNTGATADGTLLGTPLYMSPEQSMGRMSEIGPPSDLYSMGVILYQVFTGVTPFTYQNFGELLVAHAHEAPPPPTSKNPAMDARLEPIILRCLAKKPGERYGSAEALRAELEGVLPQMAAGPAQPTAQQPIGARPSAGGPVAGPSALSTAAGAAPSTAAVAAFSIRKVLGLAAAAGLLLGLAGGTVLYLKTRGPEPLDATRVAPPSIPGPVLEGRER
jgi:eukaryotic-like serine/threonine-protein kinase